MNLRNSFLYTFIGFGLLFTACDTFEDDALPSGDAEFQLRNSFTTTPNTDFFIDLKTTLNTGEVVRFALNDLPSKGEASISEEAILHYKPFQDFMSGSDLMTIDLFNLDGVLLDTDSIIIIMTDSVDIPCFNGALPDYYILSKNEPLVFDPSLNDGFCPDQLKSFNLVLADPTNGEISRLPNSETKFVYTPNNDFVGTDSIRYELKLEDLNEEIFESISGILFNVIDSSSNTNGCDSLLVPMIYELAEGQEYIEVLPYKPLPACDVIDYDVQIAEVTGGGEAEITENKLIRYYPNGSTIGTVSYSFSALNFEDELNFIVFKVVAGQDSSGCAEAFDDQYFFDLSASDSVGIKPFVFAPFENDNYCSQNFTIEILEAPDLGTATVVDSMYIQMQILAEFQGLKTTRLKYQLCDGGDCDAAYSAVTVQK